MKSEEPTASKGMCLVVGLTISLSLFEILHCCFFPRCITFKLFLTIHSFLYLSKSCGFWFGFAISYNAPRALFTSVMPCALYTTPWRVHEILSQLLGRSSSHTLLVVPPSTAIAHSLPAIIWFSFKSLSLWTLCLLEGKHYVWKLLRLPALHAVKTPEQHPVVH